MNGDYTLSETPHSNTSLFPIQFKDYPGGTEYFDVYSPPIKTLYSQVFWTRLPSVPLPEEIVTRFAGKPIAVVGFEVDQVRKTPDGDVSVPINVAYNHHFESTILGKDSVLERVKHAHSQDSMVPNEVHGHGVHSNGEAWVVRDLNPDSAFPNSQAFGAANGGEYRKSFHGFPPGYAKILMSPAEFSLEPMQIDTWNRDKMNLTGSKFVPGPVPRNSLAPVDGPDAIYSGLLECPVTTRIRKDIQGSYTVTRRQHHPCTSPPPAGTNHG